MTVCLQLKKCGNCGGVIPKNEVIEIVTQRGSIKKVVGYICNSCLTKLEKMEEECLRQYQSCS